MRKVFSLLKLTATAFLISNILGSVAFSSSESDPAQSIIDIKLFRPYSPSFYLKADSVRPAQDRSVTWFPKLEKLARAALHEADVAAGRPVAILVKEVYFNNPETAREEVMEVFKSTPELSDYFTAAEKKIVADKAVRIIRENHGKLDAMGVIKYLTVHVGRSIIDKIMEKVGVSIPVRRQVWSNKIVSDFVDCSNNARSIVEMLDCKEMFAQGFEKNLGLALTHELTKESFSELIVGEDKQQKFINKRMDEYTSCISKKNAILEDCILVAMRAAFVEVTLAETRKQLQSTYKDPDKLNAEISKLNGSLRACANKKKEKKGFMACVDQLQLQAAQDVVGDTLSAEKVVKDAFPREERMDEIKAQAKQAFGKCFDKQKRAKRDKDGMVIITPCILSVTNLVTKEVVLVELDSSVRSNLKGQKSKVADVMAETHKSLDACWNNDMKADARELCIRNTLRVVVKSIASIKLDANLDEKYLKARPTAKKSAIDRLDACVNKVLPKNISEEKGIAQKIAPCSDEVIRDIAKSIAKVRLPEEMMSLLPAAETPEQKKEFDKKAKAAVARVPRDFDKCIDKLLPDEVMDDAVTRCFKKSINEIGEFTADLEFQAKVIPLYRKDTERGRLLKEGLLKSFSVCTSEIDKQVELEKYPDAVKLCGEKLKNDAILVVAKDQLSVILEEIEDPAFKRDPSFQKRIARRIEKRLEKMFQSNGPECCTADPNKNTGLQKAEDQARGVMGKMGQIIDYYLAYDLEQAKKDLRRIINELEGEIRAGSTKESRDRLLLWLANDTTAVDQLVKAMMRQQIPKAIEELEKDPKNTVSKDLLARWKGSLTEKETLDKVFETPRGRVVMSKLSKTIVEPLLTRGVEMESPEMQQARKAIETDIREMLAHDPGFSGQIIRDVVNQSISDQNVFVQVVAYFTDRKWERYRDLPAAIETEKFIQQKILAPLFKGDLKESDRVTLMAEAESRVRQILEKAPPKQK